jgi:hypothetical protein
MEIVLQWLDELDDVVFATVSSWESLRRLSLQAGLASTLALAGCEHASAALEWIPFFGGVAATSIALWFAGAAASLLRRARGGFAVRA